MSDAILGNASIGKYDVIIIGSGAGGGPVAHLLAAAGQKVLVLEAGPNWFDGLDKPGPPVPRFSNDELKFEQRHFVVPNPRVEPRTWRTSEADGDRTEVGEVNSLAKTVGGGATHADLKMPRFAPDDFTTRSLIGDVSGATFADWPVQYDELEPYYLYGEHALGVQRFVAPAPADGLPTTAHIMGTLRSGLDPKTSVTDASGRFHDIGNLYASDGSLFPTSSGYNPTMTIVALALRVAAGMVNATSPLSALAPL